MYYDFSNELDYAYINHFKDVDQMKLIEMIEDMNFALSIVFGVEQEIIDYAFEQDYKVEDDYLRKKARELYEIMIMLRSLYDEETRLRTKEVI